MKKILSIMFMAVMAAAMLSGCSNSNAVILPEPVDPTPTLGTVLTDPSVTPITSFAQSLPSHDLDPGNGWVETFPGQANVWDIYGDFDLDDGSDDQFDGALYLTVGTTAFPSDQTYGELTFSGPAMGSAQGVTVATVSNGGLTGYSALTGTYSAFLNSTSDSRLKTTLNLTSAIGTITLTWNYQTSLYDGNMTGYTPSFRVVVRNEAGEELEELLSATVDTGGYQVSDLTAYAGQNVILSFEQKSAAEDWTPHMAIIDDVSVLDSAGSPVEYVTNGDFETGTMTGWTTNTPVEYQNMTSGVRTLEGLDVTRSFYTVPNKLWGRWVDVFSNPTATAITTTVSYYTNMGSDGAGIIYATPGASNKSITSWDGDAYDRDVAMVHGLVSSQSYTSATALATSNGSQDIYFTYDITVPAGGKVSIINFIVLGTYDTGLTATDITARATEVDTEAARIVSDFWADGQYRTGMTQAQIDAISNF